MHLCNIDGSAVVRKTVDPAVRLKRSDCPTAEEIAANPATHKHRTKYYQKIMGGCIFINNVARPYTSFAMNVLTRHMHNPSQKHLKVALDLVRYLACTEE